MPADRFAAPAPGTPLVPGPGMPDGLRPVPQPVSAADAERDALMQIAGAAATARDLEAIIESSADTACAAMGAGSFAISRWDPEAGLLRTLVNAGTLAAGAERRPSNEVYTAEDHPPVAELVRTGEPYANAVDDPDADPRAIALLERLGKESDVGVPILVEGVVWGELWATTLPGQSRFRSRDVRFLEAVAGQLAGVIAREELFTTVSRLAFEDELTGLANRRALDEHLQQRMADWRERGTPLTLLVCDMDDLKTINDERGHHAGDRALKRVARALVKAASPYTGSLVARISGDEFAVVLGGVRLNAAAEVAGTALRILGAERDTRISVSCGAAAAAPDYDRPDRLMRAADAAQYASKRRGGGQLCTAGVDTFTESMAASGRQPSSPRRRGRRRGTGELLEEAQADVLAMLDGQLADRPVLDRLEAVCAAFAGVVNTAGWAISMCPHGGDVVFSVSAADTRDERLQSVRVGLEDEVYQLRDFPLTADVMGKGAGSFLVDRRDRDGDAAERELLVELGYTGVLGAAVSDIEATYLIELYADEDTRDLAAARLPVSLLARAAVAYASAVVDDVRHLRKRTRHRDVTAALGSRLTQVKDEREVIEAAAEALGGQLTPVLTAVCRLHDDGRLTSAAARGTQSAFVLENWDQSASVGLIGRAIRERAPVVSLDVPAEPDYRPFDAAHIIRSEICAPIWTGDAIWGVLDVEDDRPDAFDEDDVLLARAVADLVGTALHAMTL